MTTIERAGGIAVLIPPRVDARMAAAVIWRVDELMPAGGVVLNRAGTPPDLIQRAGVPSTS